MFTYNFDFYGRPLPGREEPMASEDDLWERWRVVYREGRGDGHREGDLHLGVELGFRFVRPRSHPLEGRLEEGCRLGKEEGNQGERITRSKMTDADQSPPHHKS